MRSAVQREIRQQRPFRSRSQEAIIALLRTVDIVRRPLGRIVEVQGITLQQYNVLRILRGAGPEGLPTLEIADRMVERAPGITGLMDRLEARNLVKRLRCPRDRRRVLCFVTDRGLELLLQLDEPMRLADEACLGMLNRQGLSTLIRLLDQIRAGHCSSPERGDTNGRGRGAEPRARHKEITT
jgi:DNA-binding MarR family transcriptional regulator